MEVKIVPLGPSIKLAFSFNVLLLEKFRKSGERGRILLGDNLGKIHVLNHSTKEIEFQLETKGGPVQTLQCYPITRISSSDLLVGDSLGNITLFSDGELLNRQSLPDPITSICVFSDTYGLIKMFVGDYSGSITCLSGLGIAISETFKLPQFHPSSIPEVNKIQCIIVIKANEQNLGDYIAVASNDFLLHIFADSQHIRSIKVPEVITQMCVGQFTSSNTQILLGCRDGCLYVVDELSSVSLYASVGYPILQLLSIEVPKLKISKVPSSLVVCSGYWNGIRVFHQKKLLQEFTSNDWIHTMDVVEIQQTDSVELCLGQYDNSLQFLSLQWNLENIHKEEITPENIMSDM